MSGFFLMRTEGGRGREGGGGGEGGRREGGRELKQSSVNSFCTIVVRYSVKEGSHQGKKKFAHLSRTPCCVFVESVVYALQYHESY